MGVNQTWRMLRKEAEALAQKDAAMAPLMQAVMLPSKSITEALGCLLSEKLATKHLPESLLLKLFGEIPAAAFENSIVRDLQTISGHDPAAHDTITPFLFFKGFHALQSYRLAHHLWNKDRRHLALYLQNRISDLFGVDIHPAATIGSGVMMDHATGIVIGETAVVEDGVLFWHNVTLGGKSFTQGDRHPKVRAGVLLGAHATLIGNIEVGTGAKVAAGSVVVGDVPAGATVAGTPARVVS